MRRQQSIAQVLYNHLYPNPSANDPTSFAVHLARNLVPEVRIEVATFYGDLNSTEARYPGLNYCHGPHRLRLGRFKHHRRLFDAFDNLGLTYGEIQDFCCWEGTKWARERYEKDEGIKVLDTTGDDIADFVDNRERHASPTRRRQSITRKTDISVVVEDTRRAQVPSALLAEDPLDEEMSDAETERPAIHSQVVEGPEEDARHYTLVGDDESRASPRYIHDLATDFVPPRRGQGINQRIIAAWEQGQSLPPEIEQYLKEQSERGILRIDLNTHGISNAHDGSSGSTAMSTAFAGQAAAA